MSPIGSDLPIIGRVSRLPLGKLGPAGDVPAVIRELVETGLIHPVRPDKLARIIREVARWGTTPAASIAASNIESPNDVGFVDELGELTFRDLHERSNALAHGWRADGIEPGDGIAIMCRNHRGFVDATVAAAKLGASVLYMNTGFSAPQFRDGVEREEPSVLIYDEEFDEVLEPPRTAGGRDLRCFLGWREDSDAEPPD